MTYLFNSSVHLYWFQNCYLVLAQYILIHFLFLLCLIQIRELESLLCHSDSPSQLIWTSSRNAVKSNFNLEDIQHSKGQEPYSSSKYAIDLLSVALNRNFNQRVRPVSVIWKWQGSDF